MKARLLFPLIGLACMPAAHAQSLPLGGGINLAGQAMPQVAPDPELNWRDPQWLSRRREPSRWRYQLGLEQQLRSPVHLGPQAATREALWAGVSYEFSRRLSGGLETPLWQRDSGWASRMAFERSKGEGLAGLRGAFCYQLGPQSRLTLRPQAHRVMLSYSATW